MSKIKNIKAKEIKDSRGNPTIEVELRTDKGVFVASVPSGASTGKNEALELRDEDGKGVKKAIKNINKIIAPKLEGKDPVEQKEIDDLMISLDGTENKSRLGANAILAVSMAVCRAGAGVKKISLYQHVKKLCDLEDSSLRGGNSRRSNLKTDEIASPRLRAGLAMTTGYEMPLAMFNILEGGKHAHNDLEIQEFMIVPQKKSFAENLILCNKIFQSLKNIIEKNYGNVELGDEGGFAPQISKTEQALYLLKSAIKMNSPAGGIKIALDAAASQFYKEGKYKIENRELTRTELLEFYEDLMNRFPIILIEDPFAEEDWQGFESIVRLLCDHHTHTPVYGCDGVIVVGDDLTTTNIKRIKEAHNKSACNGVILKLNQIGTVSETIKASNLAKSFGWKTIVSHRSGETMDNFIADFAVGVGADYIKAGSPAKEERMVKYKRLLEIERELSGRK